MSSLPWRITPRAYQRRLLLEALIAAPERQLSHDDLTQAVYGCVGDAEREALRLLAWRIQDTGIPLRRKRVIIYRLGAWSDDDD